MSNVKNKDKYKLPEPDGVNYEDVLIRLESERLEREIFRNFRR
jgi:hypothetical protein